MAGKADPKRLKQSNDPLRNDKPTTNFPKTKAPHQDFPTKSKNPPPKISQNLPKSDETGWNPKKRHSPFSLFFLTIPFSWSWHARRSWCSYYLWLRPWNGWAYPLSPGNPVTNVLLNSTIPPTRFSKLLHFPTTTLSHKVNVDDRWSMVLCLRANWNLHSPFHFLRSLWGESWESDCDVKKDGDGDSFLSVSLSTQCHHSFIWLHVVRCV